MWIFVIPVVLFASLTFAGGMMPEKKPEPAPTAPTAQAAPATPAQAAPTEKPQR
jgi:hypothetical protein